jgi:SAM-dependent methyltransferase
MFTASTGYEAYMGRWSRQLAPLYVAWAAPRNGDRVLDVGTGTGALASALQAALPSSEIVGIDPSEGFIGAARRSARSPRARFEVGDAQALKFADASFDQALSMLVINFVPDHGKALAEMRRVTRPGGVVSACVWDYGDGMESLRIFWDEAVALDPAAEPRHERNMKLTRAGELGALWRKADLEDVQEKPLVIDQAFKSIDDYWDPFLAGVGPGGAYVVSLAADKRQELKSRLQKRLGDGAFTLKARVWCARGTVP